MFSAFSPLNGGTDRTYYQDKNYPIDLNGALDYSRVTNSPPAHFPFPVVIGAINGLVPLFTDLSLAMGYGKTPFGAWQGEAPAPLSVAFPAINGGMVKE